MEGDGPGPLLGTPDDSTVEALESMLEIVDGRPTSSAQDVIDAIVARARPHGRGSGDPIERAADLAASGQVAYARLVDRILESCASLGERNLVLSGGLRAPIPPTTADPRPLRF